jgi:Nuclease-related domain
MRRPGSLWSRRGETYARLRYERGLRSWRRWVRWRLLPVFAPVFLAAVVWGLSQHHNGAFFAGMIAGASAAMFMAFREFAPPYVENWGQGSEGERKTHEVLAALDWVLVEDVDTGRGTYDHLLAGPPGVFMIETKCAARRPVVSPAQPGGTRREVLGSSGLPGSER